MMDLDNNYKLQRDNWSALQELYGDLYKIEKNESSEDAHVFWHYTSAKGVLGIFGEFINDPNDSTRNVEHCSMLASNIRFMNDSKEYEEGVEFYNNLSKTIDEKIKHFFDANSSIPINDNIYLISFCGNGDLLSQWKWYGKNSGVSIKFNIDKIAYRTYEYRNDNGKIKDWDLVDPHTKPLRIKYKEKEKKEYFQTLLNQSRIHDSEAYDLVRLAFVPFCKHEGFAEEKESRLVFYIGDLDIDETIKGVFDIKYNTFEEGRIKPALNVNMELHDEGNDAHNIISEMIVGPGINQEIVFNFLIHAFDRKNYYYHNGNSGNLQWDDFILRNDHKVYSVNCKDGKLRDAYKCENGIVIMKSSIPFRG